MMHHKIHATFISKLYTQTCTVWIPNFNATHQAISHIYTYSIVKCATKLNIATFLAIEQSSRHETKHISQYLNILTFKSMYFNF